MTVEATIRHKVPFGVVAFDAWYLSEDLVRVLVRQRKDWISLLKKNRLLETASFHLRDANGWPLRLQGPQIAIEEWVPLTPANAYRPINAGEQTYWCFTLTVRIPGRGKVRIVVSFETEQLTGRSVVLVTNRVDWSVERGQDHQPVLATVADRNVLSGQPGAVGLQRVSHAECRGHWETLVSGVRGPFVVAPDVSACRIEREASFKPLGCLSATRARVVAEAVAVRP